MKHAPKLSVITLTKNRAKVLRQHLSSIVGQTQPGDEIVVVNNNSTDHTQRVIREFADILPIRSFFTKQTGYAQLYNYAIAKCRNPIVVFFDDDCIASPNFLKGHRNAHANNSPHVVQGLSKSIPKGNIYAEIMGDHYRNWVTMYMTKNGKMRTFDNKNASFPVSLIQKYGGYSHKLAGGAEDIEFGFRLSRQGVPILFAPHIVSYHHERDTLRAFIIQHLRFARTDAQLARHLHHETTLSMFVGYKIYLHAISALRREIRYILSGNIVAAMYLPFLYILLFILRIWGYATSK